MASLSVNKTHKWNKSDGFATLSLAWANPSDPGTGSVSVKIGDIISSQTVPQTDIAVNKEGGKITNNTSKTINYTLA